MSLKRKNRTATILLIVLLLALPVAAVVQTVWLNSAARGEADRMRRGLGNVTHQIRSDLLFELGTIARLLPPGLSQDDPNSPVDIDELSEVFPEFYSSWRDRTEFPGLIEKVTYFGPLTDWIPYSFDFATKEFAEDSSIDAAARLLELNDPNWEYEENYAIYVPLDKAYNQVTEVDGALSISIVETGHLLIWLDREYLSSTVAPELVGTYLGEDLSDYQVAVVDYDKEAVAWSNFDTSFQELNGNPPDDTVDLVYRPIPGAGLLEFRRRDTEKRTLDALSERFRDPVVQQWLSSRASPDEVPPDEADPGLRAETPTSGIRILIWHAAGSVDAAARVSRNRNLAFSYAALALIAGATVAFYMLYRRANRQREKEHEFVATVTHELRTPVAAMHAVSENLAEGIVTDPERVQEYGSAMLDEGRRLRTMIDQVLLYAGLLDKSRARLSEIRLDEIVTRTISSVPGLRRDHLTIHVEPRLPGFRGDSIAIESVLRNLLSNAVKHNEETTRITLSVRSDRGSGRGHKFDLVIGVTDDGRGIPRRELNQVREPFFRGSQSQADQVPGSGLGLSLVKRIADTYGGTLDISSTPGAGTTVTVRLPFAGGVADEA